MPFFMVTHNITDAAFFKENVAAMVSGACGMGPGCAPINKDLMAETGDTLYQHSINFPPGPDAKIGWCVFESKPGSDWTAEKLKTVQDTEKKAWAVQDVTEIMKPAGVDAKWP